jgi:hypothetical protein
VTHRDPLVVPCPFKETTPLQVGDRLPFVPAVRTWEILLSHLYPLFEPGRYYQVICTRCLNLGDIIKSFVPAVRTWEILSSHLYPLFEPGRYYQVKFFFV